MGFIAWLVLGLIAGFIASKLITATGEGLVMDIVRGMVGAVLGSVGAVIVLVICRLIVCARLILRVPRPA